MMWVIALLISSGAMQTAEPTDARQEDIWDYSQRIAKEAAQPVPEMTSEEIKEYIESLGEWPDAVAYGLNRQSQLDRAFAPYFRCYRESLDRDARSGLRNFEATARAFQSARVTCDQKRIAGFAAAAEIDPREKPDVRHRALEYYIQKQGDSELGQYYAGRGLSQRFQAFISETTKAR